MASSGTGKGKGRRKIKMEKMENESNLQVTFSKRRCGVFKKAHELSILTGAEIAAIVFSPGGKVYSFGHPTTEAVIDRFLTGISKPLTLTQQIVQAQRNDRVVETNKKLAKVKEMIEFERNRKESLGKVLAEIPNHHWGGINLDEQNLSQIQQSIEALKNTKAEVEREVNARVSAKQNNNEPSGSYNQNGVESGCLPLALMGPTYEDDGSTNILTTLTQPIAYANSDGGGSNESNGNNGYGFFPFFTGHGISGVGGNSNVLLGSTGLGFYGNGGGWSLNYEQTLLGGGSNGGGPFIDGSSSFIGGGGGNFPNTYEASSFGHGNGSRRGWSFCDRFGPFRGGSEPFIAEPGSFVSGGNDDSLPNTDNGSSLGVGYSGGGDGDGGSNSRVSKWYGSMPFQ